MMMPSTFEYPEVLTSLKKFVYKIVEHDDDPFHPRRAQITARSRTETLFEIIEEKKLSERSLKVFYKNWQFQGKLMELQNDVGLDELQTEDSPPEFVIWCTDIPKVFLRSRITRPGAGHIIKSFGNLNLREPQRGALEKMAETFGSTSDDDVSAQRFMSILPTGCGKTTVMALAPFMLNAISVLIITPGIQILDQIVRNLKTFFGQKSEFRKSVGGDMPTIEKYCPTMSDDANIVVANIQALFATSADGSTLKPEARRHFDNYRFDLCLVDEGHHCPANSWTNVERILRDINPLCKTLLLTATPQRGDGLKYGLAGPQSYYLFPRKDAVREKYIKSTTYHPIDVAKPSSPNELDKSYLEPLIVPAVEKLLELRRSCDNIPLRLLITVQTKSQAKQTEDVFKQLSEERRWGLSAGAIIGQPDSTSNLRLFEERSLQERLDVAIQCQMLGEGYDFDLIAITLFVTPMLSVGRVSQYHGRALRRPSCYDECRPQLLYAHLFYPTWNVEMNRAIAQYQAGVDEDVTSLFTPDEEFKSLRDANTQLGKLATDAIATQLKTHFAAYHNLYRAVRQEWSCIPAEYVADEIYRKFINCACDIANVELSIVDFGCGDEGLFEHKLSTLIQDHAATEGCIDVKVCALDVVPLATAATLTRSYGPTRSFTCTTVEGNYCDFRNDHVGAKFDIGVFCLSMMATDALCEGLKQASKVVKPFGNIFIVQDVFKLGGLRNHPDDKKNQTIYRFCRVFEERTGLRVHSAAMIPKTIHVLLHIVNVGNDERTSLVERLENVSFKSIAKSINDIDPDLMDVDMCTMSESDIMQLSAAAIEDAADEDTMDTKRRRLH